MVYKYKVEGRSPKDFRNYKNLIELFKDLRDGNLNLKEVLKDQIKFKSDLRKIKKEIQIKIRRSNKCNTKCWKLFLFKRKKYWFFRGYSFFLSEAKYKAKYGEGLKILTSKQMLQRLLMALAQVTHLKSY